MTLEELVALTFAPGLPLIHVAARLRTGDPGLTDVARPYVSDARHACWRAHELGIDVVAWDDARYPALLLPLPDFPPVLWTRGSLDALAAPTVAVVGSRTATPVGLAIAARLGSDLAAAGVTVVSGLARGVDSAAHRGALSAGRTVAVLGCGVDVAYPPEHAPLAADIARTGAVLSEYPPGTPPRAYQFPQRNRLISGLARAVVVVEAAEASGSLITARCALEQGREVMAVPGNVLSGRNRGTHALIRDGAVLVERAEDVLQELGLPWKEAAGSEAATDSYTRSSGDPLLRVMEPGHPFDLDVLCERSGLDAQKALPHLLDLELRGLVARLAGGRFMRPT